MTRSNLECFLYRTTPTIRSQFLPKSSLNNLNTDWHPLKKDRIEYFNLGDLWDRYDEWSAYGVGTPVTYGDRTVVQYFTPYLSAIQLYTLSAKGAAGAVTATASTSDMGGDSECEFEYKSWSSDSSEAGGGGGAGKLSRSSSSNSDRMWDVVDDLDGCCWPPVKSRFGDLYMEHFEEDGPFGRVPLKDKIDELAQKYPGLRSLNSIDLSAASWMAVAWYPIYNIPPGRNSRDISASFLTYHTLSSSFQDDYDLTEGVYDSDEKAEEKKEGQGTVSLSPFGLATYRMQPRVWLNPETSDQELLSSLACAADSWLKQLQVYHHDFSYFMAHPFPM